MSILPEISAQIFVFVNEGRSRSFFTVRVQYNLVTCHGIVCLQIAIWSSKSYRCPREGKYCENGERDPFI